MNAIITMAIGEGEQRAARISHPLMKKYAKRIGADFIVISQRRWPELHMFFEKFQMHETVKRYDRTLYVDTDIMINPKAPNIFDAVPPGSIGLYDEAEMKLEFPPDVPKFSERINSIVGLCEPIPVGWKWDGTYFNAGVMVLEPQFAWLMQEKPTGKMIHADLADQGLLNMRIQRRKLPVCRLPQTWNFMVGHLKASITDAALRNFAHFTWYLDKKIRNRSMRILDLEWILSYPLILP